MALVPSSNDESDNRNTNNEKDRKNSMMNVFNRHNSSSLSVNQFNVRPAQDRSTYEQLYQFQESRDRLSSNSNRQRHSDGKPIVMIDTTYNNPPPENSGLQLPLIETHHSRPKSRNSLSRKPSESLGILPLKHRRTLLNYNIPSSSDDAKRELLRLAGHETTIQITSSTFESLPSRTNSSIQRIRTYSREDYDGNIYHHEPTTISNVKSFNHRNQKPVPERLSSTHRFLGHNGKERAAIVIQSFWRGVRTRQAYKKLKKRKWAVNVIASAWLTHSKLSQIRNHLKLTRHRQLEFFHLKQNEFKENWLLISSNRRVIVHLPSLGLTEHTRKKLKNLSLRENYQIGRLCELEDPNVDIIYVSSVDVNDEILQYYNKLIHLRTMVEQGSEQPLPSTSNHIYERFKIIIPEALHSFPKHNMCLSTLLKYSPKALKQIKTLIKDRQAYLVSGISHMDDLHIAEYLNIPIYGCEPEASYLYSTKSGSKRIFKSSNVPMPFGEYDIYDEKHLLNALTQLIIDHSDVQRWLFKIDDQFDGLGIAYCDIAIYLPCYDDFVKEVENSSKKSVSKDFYGKILSELPNVLDKYTIYVNKAQFNSWKTFMSSFLSQGGIIEAYPPSDSITSLTICLAIEFDGQNSLICSGDQLHAESQYSCWGLAFPQSSVDPKELNNYCALIAEQCKQRHIYGYIDLDFVTFIETKTDKQQIWITDLSVGYSEHLSLFRVMKYVTTGQFNSQKHSFTVQMKQPKQRLRNWQNGAPEYTIIERNRYAIWSSRLYHTNLSTIPYSMFFQICRSHAVGFDVREKQGSIFTLLEGNHHDHIGMITISETLQQTLSNFISNLNVIHREIVKTTEIQGQNNFMLAVNEIENILDTTQDNASNVSLNTTTS
ncbi:hypothetical protein I4U23_024486 [Adineta vaga]|nr:hypothetical protein I4U23_024486 [Adineta vaga]